MQKASKKLQDSPRQPFLFGFGRCMNRDHAPLSYEFGPFQLDVLEHRLLEGRPASSCSRRRSSRFCESSSKTPDIWSRRERLLSEVWPDSYVGGGGLNRNVSIPAEAPRQKKASGTQYIQTVSKAWLSIRRAGDRLRRRRGHNLPPRPALRGSSRSGSNGRATRGGCGRRRDASRCGLVARGVAPCRPGLTRSRAEGDLAPAGDLHGRGTCADGVAGRQAHRLCVEWAGEPARGAGTRRRDPRSRIFAAAEIGHVRWSPDGSEMLLWTRGGGRHGVYVLPQLGGAPRAIADGQYTACWSPDGSAIAVAEVLVGKIRLYDSVGREQQILTLHGEHWAIWDIDWTANGDRLVYTSSDRQGRYTISTIRADGTGQQKILSVRAEIPSVRWAPDGDAIYYFQRVNQTLSLHRMTVGAGDAAAGGLGTALLTGLEADGFLGLSADARRLVYARAPYHSNLRMLDSVTGRTIELTRGTSLIEAAGSVAGRALRRVQRRARAARQPAHDADRRRRAKTADTPRGAGRLGGAWSADRQSNRLRIYPWRPTADSGPSGGPPEADAAPAARRGRERQPRRRMVTRAAHPVPARAATGQLIPEIRIAQTASRTIAGRGGLAGMDVRPALLARLPQRCRLLESAAGARYLDNRHDRSAPLAGASF